MWTWPSDFGAEDAYRLLQFGRVQRIEWMLRVRSRLLRSLLLYFSWNCHIAAFAVA